MGILHLAGRRHFIFHSIFSGLKRSLRELEWRCKRHQRGMVASVWCDMQGESVRSQWGIKMTTRRCPLLSVLDSTGSHFDGLEQSSEKKVMKTQLKPNIWCLKLTLSTEILSGAYPQVLKSHSPSSISMVP